MASPGLDLDPAPIAATPSTPPTVGAIVRRVAHSLLIACVAPIALFYVCFAVWGLMPAMMAALAWAYGAIAFRAVTGRRASGLLVLTALVLTARTAVALAADSTFVYFLQPVITDAVVGLAFLISLGTARPIVARLAVDFYPMDDEVAARPRVQRLLRRLTALWSAVILAKAVVVLWLLTSQSLETFVLVQGISVVSLTVVTTALTIAAAVMVARREGLIAPRALAIAGV